MAMAKVTRIKDSTIVMFNMCIPSLWYWKLIFQWAKTTMKSISFETYIYIYIYVTYITLHYIRMRRATMHVCAWCLPYMRITLMRFFPVYFLHIQNKKSTLGLPMWGIGKTNPDPRATAPSSRHICTIAICSHYRFGKRPKSSADLAEAAKAVAPAAGSHSIWKITRGTRIQLVLQIVLAQPAQTITGTDRRCGPAIASHTTGTKSCNHKFLLLALAQSDAHAVWFIWRLDLQMTGDPLGSFQRPLYSVL